MNAIQKLLATLFPEPKPDKQLEEQEYSKHWITRNGKKIRATKKYADGRQKAK